MGKALVITLAVGFGGLLLGEAFERAVGPAAAQSTKTRSSRSSKSTRSTASVKEIDVRADKLKETLLNETAAIARDYEEVGELEQARELFEVLLKVNPDLPAVKQKIDELNEQLLSSNEFEVELDTAKGWTAPVARVIKGQTVRILAEGDYRVTLNASIGPDGFPGDDISRNMADNVPFGALMGVVVTEGKPGRPFVIKSQREWQPDKDGLLLLRVNVPPEAKCIGRLKVTLSGFTRAS